MSATCRSLFCSMSLHSPAASSCLTVPSDLCKLAPAVTGDTSTCSPLPDITALCCVLHTPAPSIGLQPSSSGKPFTSAHVCRRPDALSLKRAGVLQRVPAASRSPPSSTQTVAPRGACQPAAPLHPRCRGHAHPQARRPACRHRMTVSRLWGPPLYLPGPSVRSSPSQVGHRVAASTAAWSLRGFHVDILV